MGNFAPGAGYELRMGLIDDQRDTALPGGTPDFTILPVSTIDGPTQGLTQGPAPTLNSRLAVRRNNATDGTFSLSFTALHVQNAFAIPFQMLYGNTVAAAPSPITGTDIATTAASGGTFTFTSITATKFTSLQAHVPCPAYVKRDGASALAHLVILTDVSADGLTLTAGDGTTGNEFGTDPGVVAAGDTVTITVPRRYVYDVNEYFAMAEVASGNTRFESLDGAALTTAGFTSAKASPAEWAFGFEGINSRGPGGATYGSGTETAAPTGRDFVPSESTLVRFGVDGLMSDIDGTTPAVEYYLDQFGIDFTVAEIPVPSQGSLAAYRHVRDRVVPTASFTLVEHEDIEALLSDYKALTRTSLIYGLWMTQDNAQVDGMGFWIPQGAFTEGTPQGRAEAGLGTRGFGLAAEDKTYTVTTAPTSRLRYIMPFFFDNITL